MKVYMVNERDSRFDKRYIKLFASREAAGNYTVEQPVLFAKDYARMQELSMLYDIHNGFTAEERLEYDALRNKWGNRNTYPRYQITEFELQE